MSNKLYVGNLSFTVTDDMLAKLFSQCGNVESAKVITDRDTGRSKGFGFVEMSSSQEANDAVNKFNGTEFESRELKVSEARPQSNNRKSRGSGFGTRYRR